MSAPSNDERPLFDLEDATHISVVLPAVGSPDRVAELTCRACGARHDADGRAMYAAVDSPAFEQERAAFEDRLRRFIDEHVGCTIGGEA